MKAVSELPSNYKEIFSVDLKKNKKIAVLINGAAAAVALIMIFVMRVFVPIETLRDLQLGENASLMRIVIFAVAVVGYVVLHELTHGVVMKIVGTKKVKYRFNGLYATAGSNDYYDKSSYILIALAPIVIWGIVLAIVNFIVPTEWFWIVYTVQVMNIGGAAGDMYVTIRFSRLPKDILVKDVGSSMTVYSKQP